jgi:phosphatidylinositol alpha-1,6-mannosyltransferase
LIVANTSNTKTELVKLQQAPHRIAIIYPFIDPDRFRPNIDGSRVILRHRLIGKRILLTVARLDEVKGIDIVMRAMPHVLDAVPDAVYLIVGDGPLRKRLKTLASELGISDRVIFTGRVDYWSEELPQYYNACDVFVMTSRGTTRKGETESFGIAYLEAGACGKPVIGSRVGGVQEAIRDGVTGMLVDPTDVRDVANAAIRLLTDDRLAREMGQKGRQFAVSRSDPSVLEQVLAIAHRRG